MSHAVWCPTCRKPAECDYCGTDYPSQRAADECCPENE